MSKQSIFDIAEQVISAGVKEEILQLSASPSIESSSTIGINEKEFLNFGSCSYLGMEHNEHLIQSTIEATQKFGTQFSSSRAYLSIELYERLEGLLGEMFNAKAIVTPSTSLGHQAALPVLVKPDDSVIIDHQAHASLHVTCKILKSMGISVHIVKHNDLDHLEETIKELRKKNTNIWYIADGIYSMYGDFAPLPQLEALLEKYDNLNLYIDDAHGMSWAGDRGVGFVASKMNLHDRMVLAVSLNKAFACAGGALIFKNREWARKIRTCGGPLVFSGPVQPPLLGAAIKQAEMHLANDIKPEQDRLAHMIEYTNVQLTKHHIPQAFVSLSPIFFIPTGVPKTTFNMVKKLYDSGIYVNSGVFPATPIQKGGVRFTITAKHTEAEIDQLVQAIKYHYPRVLKEEGVKICDIQKAFKISLSEELIKEMKPSTEVNNVLNFGMKTVVKHSIAEVDKDLWNQCFEGRGAYDYNALQVIEKSFTNQALPEHNSKFYYVFCYDEKHQLILATFFTVALMKDDMLAPADISQAIESKRKDDPYYLSSPVLMLGTQVTDGNHLFLDMDHSKWKLATKFLLKTIQEVSTQEGAEKIVLRDFEEAQVEKLSGFFLENGFVKVELPDAHAIDDLNSLNIADYIASLSHKVRYGLRKEVLNLVPSFEVSTDKNLNENEIKKIFNLYKNVQQKAMNINSFTLPLDLFSSILANDKWDLIRLYLKSDHTRKNPIAAGFSYITKNNYHTMLIGLDYDYLKSHNIYKQVLWQSLVRAKQLNCSKVNLGFTASLTKKKMGANTTPYVGFVQLKDHFKSDLLSNLTKLNVLKSKHQVSIKASTGSR